MEGRNRHPREAHDPDGVLGHHRVCPMFAQLRPPFERVATFPQVDRWGGQDLNLRPTDYEFDSGGIATCGS
jgi:hypothetical protein